MHRAMFASASTALGGVELDKPEREAIHSGQFMVSHFEAEAQDDEDELAVPVPEVAEIKNEFEIVPIAKSDPNKQKLNTCRKLIIRPPIGIDTSLAKLFQCMSLAYRQKLTSPKWNRFRGIRLRWKDKIRLNNVIWRCWHMQFIKKRNTMICQFASPLDVDTHNKPEAVVLEGKYWKRKLAAVTAEYKKWRMFYRNQVMGHNKDAADMLELELLSWNAQPMDENMMVDEDYMGLMSDTLFSTITNQPFPFPDTREIAKAGLADFIQPSLGPLQPNLEDYMDTFEPFQDLICGRLATVPEEHHQAVAFKNDMWYPDYGNLSSSSIPVHPPVNLPIETYPMQPPQLPPPPRPQHVPVKPPPTLDYADPAMFAPMISKPPQPTQRKAHSMDLVPMPTKPFMSHVNQVNQINQVNIAASPSYTTNQIQDTHDMGNYKMPNSTHLAQQPPTQSYKFGAPTLPSIKFTSQTTSGGNDAQSHFNSHSLEAKKDDNKVVKPRNARGRPRSRSNTREPLKKPPLLSAVSDPSLITSSNSALLTQLLKNNDGASTLSASRVIMPLERKSASFVRVKEEVTPISILPQPAPTTLILTPVSMTPIRQTVNIDPLMINTINASNSSPGLPETCLNSPTPSQDSMGSPTRDSSRDSRRAGHIHAEQKRRYNIKNGFDMIHSLIPHLNQNPNAKLSKAAMLQKGAEYIKQLRAERNMLTEEMDSLRQQIEALNTSISNCQSLLPATGAPVSRRRDNKLQEMFDEYVRTRTAEDWKFWIFSLLFRPLLTTFNNVVSTTSMDDLYRSTMLWVEQHCTLVDLRPIVLNSLRYVCTKTDILSEPEKLPEEARQMVQSTHSHPAQ